MSRNRQFYCHRCAANVQIDVAEWKCRDCSSGFVEELTTPERNNDGMSFSISHRYIACKAVRFLHCISLFVVYSGVRHKARTCEKIQYSMLIGQEKSF